MRPIIGFDHCRSPRSGFTLTEVMFAIVIVFALSMASISSILLSRHMAEFDKQRLSALAVGRRYLEESRQSLYPSLGPIENVALDDFNTTSLKDNLVATVTRQVFVANPDGTRGEEVLSSKELEVNGGQRLEIVVSVSWNRTGSMSTHRVTESLSTYVTPVI